MIMIINNINPNKLHDELLANGINPISVSHNRKDGETIAENTWITFADDTDMDLVQQIINAHDPTPMLAVNPDEVLKSKIEIVTINTLIDLGVI